MTDRGESSEGPGSGTFCPACGDPMSSTPDRPRAGDRRAQALCDRCYVDRHDAITAPAEVTLTICSDCGAVRRDGGWTDVAENEDYASVAVTAVREGLGIHVDAEDVRWHVTVEQVDATSLRVECRVTGTIRGRDFDSERTVPVTLGRGTCDRCGRIAGDDHAAVLQLRAHGRTPTAEECDRTVTTAREYVADRAKTGDRDAFISDVDSTADGIDIRLSRPALGRGIADRIRRQLGGTVNHSRTLVTEDEEGDPVYRLTSVVRLGRFRPGDVLKPPDGGAPAVVRSVDAVIKATSLRDGATVEVPLDGGDNVYIGHRSDAVETTVVTVEDERAVQILDPKTQEPTTVERPVGLASGAGSVEVLRGGERLYIVPPTGFEGDDAS